MTTGDRGHRRRGQSGLTIIELLMVVVLGTIVLIPLFGLMNQTLLRRQPTNDSADAAKQLRLFRSSMADDWAEGKLIRVNPTDPTAFNFNCSGGGNAGGSDNIKIAIWSSDNNRRVLYKLTPTATVDGPFQLLRSECNHTQDANPPYLWGFGNTTNGSSTEVVADKVSELRLPETCNPDYAPFTPCDMNVTLKMTNGDSATVRLHQYVGRKS